MKISWGKSTLRIFWSLRYLIRYLLVTQFSPERQKLMWSFAKKCSNAVYFSQHCLLFLLRKGNPDPELQNSRVYVCSSIYWQQNSGNIAKKIPYYPHRLTPDFCLLCYRIHSRFEFYTYFFYWEKVNPYSKLQKSRVYVCSSIYWQQNSGNIA